MIFSSNHKTFAIDSTGTGWELTDYPTNSWVKHLEWGVVYGLQADGQGNIYSLYGPGGGGCINEGSHSVGEWNGSGWSQLTYCFLQFFTSQDGGSTILTIDVNGTLWTNVGGWQHASVPSPWKPTISATMISSTQNAYMVVLNDNSIWAYDGSNWSIGPSLQVVAVALYPSRPIAKVRSTSWALTGICTTTTAAATTNL